MGGIFSSSVHVKKEEERRTRVVVVSEAYIKEKELYTKTLEAAAEVDKGNYDGAISIIEHLEEYDPANILYRRILISRGRDTTGCIRSETCDFIKDNSLFLDFTFDKMKKEEVPATAIWIASTIMSLYFSSSDPEHEHMFLCTISAHRGCPFAMVKLGKYYERQQRVEESARIIQEAADLGDFLALLEIARMYLKGEGKPRDIPRGILMVQQLSDNGYANASWYLGCIYDNGLFEKEKDWARAISYFEKSIVQGDITSTRDLALVKLYMPIPDVREAVRLLEIAKDYCPDIPNLLNYKFKAQ